MADLMGGGSAGGSRSSQHVASVTEERISVGGDLGGVIAVPVETLKVLLEIEVQSLVVALAKLLLHGQVVAIGRPLLVDGPVGALERELEAGVLVTIVEVLKLLLNSCGLFNLYMLEEGVSRVVRSDCNLH